MNFCILLVAISVVVTSVCSYKNRERHESANDYLEAQANRVFEDPRLDFQTGNLIDGFNTELLGANDYLRNGKFGNPGEEDEETDDSWNLFWKHYQIQRNHDSSHHFHHRHFPWQDRQGTLQPSLVSTAPTTESSTISIQSEVPLIDIRSDANGAK